jgi:hypothetical protein
VNNPDLITSKLPALRAYQHSLDAPKPPNNSFNQASAAKGKAIFITKAKCATCHTFLYMLTINCIQLPKLELMILMCTAFAYG